MVIGRLHYFGISTNFCLPQLRKIQIISQEAASNACRTQAVLIVTHKWAMGMATQSSKIFDLPDELRGVVQ